MDSTDFDFFQNKFETHNEQDEHPQGINSKETNMPSIQTLPPSDPSVIVTTAVTILPIKRLQAHVKVMLAGSDIEAQPLHSKQNQTSQSQELQVHSIEIIKQTGNTDEQNPPKIACKQVGRPRRKCKNDIEQLNLESKCAQQQKKVSNSQWIHSHA